MSRPEDIPESVWETALRLAEECGFDGHVVRSETNLTDAWASVDELCAQDIGRAMLAERLAERERIALWHEAQASSIEAALEKIAAEGGTVEVSRRTLADLHRDFAAAIRRGDA